MTREELREKVARGLEKAEPWSSFWSRADALKLADAAIALIRGNELANQSDRIAALESALEPFIRAADTFDNLKAMIDPRDCFVYSGVSSAAGPVGAITVADLRRAREIAKT
jgi:hypothetical protein